MFVAIPWASKTNHTRGGARFEHRNFRDIGLQPGSSCKSPDSQYATTDMCSSTPAVRCRRNEGTCTQTYAHKYLWQGLYCQVICTKWPYHRLNDSSTLGSQALLYQRQHRRRKIRPPAAKVQPLRGARLKAPLALDFAYVNLAVRAIHLGRPMPSEAVVDGVPCLDVVIFGTSRQGTGDTDIPEAVF